MRSTGWARMSTGWARMSTRWARMSTGWARKVQVAFAAVAALLFGGMGMAYAGVLPKAVLELPTPDAASAQRGLIEPLRIHAVA